MTEAIIGIIITAAAGIAGNVAQAVLTRKTEYKIKKLETVLAERPQAYMDYINAITGIFALHFLSLFTPHPPAARPP